MNEYNLFDGSTIQSKAGTTMSELLEIFTLIEALLNKKYGITNAESKYTVKPTKWSRGGFDVHGGPHEAKLGTKANKPFKSMRFGTCRTGEVNWPQFVNETKPDHVIFADSNSKYILHFYSKSKWAKWTRDEVCIVENCFKAAGFTCSNTLKNKK